MRRGIKDTRLLETMRVVPRHLFVSKHQRSFAYAGMPIAVGFGQTISQPYLVALMTEALELKGNEKVLEIGNGSGYQAAILSRLAKEVISVEPAAKLAIRARKILRRMGATNVKVVHGNGRPGLPEEAPFDAILVNTAEREIPALLVEQLANHGRLVVPLGVGWRQRIVKILKEGEIIRHVDLGLGAFTPLIGKRIAKIDGIHNGNAT